MRRSVRVLVLSFALVPLLGLAACTTQHDATFVRYEMEGFSAVSNLFGGGLSDEEVARLKAENPLQRTGMARVRLGDGTELMAACPYENLSPGKTQVQVQQNSDGSWVVVRVLN